MMRYWEIKSWLRTTCRAVAVYGLTLPDSAVIKVVHIPNVQDGAILVKVEAVKPGEWAWGKPFLDVVYRSFQFAFVLTCMMIMRSIFRHNRHIRCVHQITYARP